MRRCAPAFRDLFDLPVEASVSGQLDDAEWVEKVSVEALLSPSYPVDPLSQCRSDELACGRTCFQSQPRQTKLHPSFCF